MEHELKFDGALNCRDLGGYDTPSGKKIKPHKLIRTAQLSHLTDAGVKQLKEAGVKYVVDFRTKQEVSAAPDRLPEGVKYYHLPVFEVDETVNDAKERERIETFSKDPTSGYKHMLQVYEDIVKLTSAKEAYRKFFDILLENKEDGQAVAFHCAAGKDRTGMAAAYAMAALGASWDTVVYDYLASNRYLADFQARETQRAQAHGEAFVSNTQALNSVNADYIARARQTLEAEAGGIKEYLRTELLLGPEEIKQLQEVYLKRDF